MTIQPAQLNVAVKRNGSVLYRVGEFGRKRSADVADFIKLCSNRVRTNREHNNN